MQAYLILANGRVFRGVSVGCPGTTIGEVVFATGMVGFEETLTDPSYYGQIITQTYPLIGNYGMNSEDVESTKIWARGYIVREACKTPSNFRSEETLDAFLKKNGIIGIEGIDTRSLTRTLRESGVMNGAITTEFDPDAEPEKKAELLPEIAAYADVNAGKAVSCRDCTARYGRKLARHGKRCGSFGRRRRCFGDEHSRGLGRDGVRLFFKRQADDKPGGKKNCACRNQYAASSEIFHKHTCGDTVSMIRIFFYIFQVSSSVFIGLHPNSNCSKPIPNRAGRHQKCELRFFSTAAA